MSDRVPLDELPTLEQRMDDVRAVMEAVGSERAVLCGVSEGGPMCSLFSATYPEKTSALVMIGSYARRLRGVDAVLRSLFPQARPISAFVPGHSTYFAIYFTLIQHIPFAIHGPCGSVMP